MKRNILFLSVIALVIISIITVAVSSGKKSGKSTLATSPSPISTKVPHNTLNPIDEKTILTKLKGIWVEEQYIENLKKCKSPVKAEFFEKNGCPMYIKFDNFLGSEEIKKNPNAKYFEIESSPSDTSGPNSYGEISSFSKTTTADQYTANITVYGKDLNKKDLKNTIIIDKSDFNENKITYVANAPYKLVYIGHDWFDTFWNKEVLKGKYKSPDGKIYEFTDDMTAIWPDKKFKYTISTNLAGHPMDIIIPIINDGPSYNFVYTYEIKDNKLFISLYENSNIKPLLILEKI